MKFSIKTYADKAPEITLGGLPLDPDKLAGIEFRAGNGAIPHVVLTLIPAEVEIDVARAAVTQVEADGPPPAPQPNREQRRAGKK
jgi:hypothetical protein